MREYQQVAGICCDCNQPFYVGYDDHPTDIVECFDRGYHDLEDHYKRTLPNIERDLVPDHGSPFVYKSAPKPIPAIAAGSKRPQWLQIVLWLFTFLVILVSGTLIATYFTGAIVRDVEPKEVEDIDL